MDSYEYTPSFSRMQEYNSQTEALASQINLVIDLSRKLVGTENIDLINSQAILFQTLLGSLERELFNRESTYKRALVKTSNRHEELVKEMSRCEQELERLKSIQSTGLKHTKSSSSQVSELIDLKEKLRRQVFELQHLWVNEARKDEKPALPKRRPSSEEEVFDPLSKLVFKNRY